MEIFIVKGDKTKEINICLNEFLKNQKALNNTRDTALVVGGDQLTSITKNEKMKEKMLELAETANVVIACRVSPK